jgi:hypothetical protein
MIKQQLPKMRPTQRSSLGLTSVTFGLSATDIPIRGDFDGDGKADVAVYRMETGHPANTYFILRSSDGAVQSRTFGNILTDYIVPADFDGDGKTDYAVWRGRGIGTSGTWYWEQSSDGAARALTFGNSTDLPVMGDYDGDGKTDQGGLASEHRIFLHQPEPGWLHRSPFRRDGRFSTWPLVNLVLRLTTASMMPECTGERAAGRDKARALLSRAGVVQEKVIEHIGDKKRHLGG